MRAEQVPFRRLSWCRGHACATLEGDYRKVHYMVVPPHAQDLVRRMVDQ